MDEEVKIEKIIQILLDNENDLTAGFWYYSRTSSDAEKLREIAVKILKKLESVP